MKEAMQQVKEELGSDAVILHTKKYREGGFLGYHSREVVEVTAAIEDQDTKTVKKQRVQAPTMRGGRPADVWISFLRPRRFFPIRFCPGTRRMEPKRVYIWQRRSPHPRLRRFRQAPKPNMHRRIRGEMNGK